MDSLIEGRFSAIHAHQDAVDRADAVAAENNTERQAATPYEPFLEDWYPAAAAQTDAGSLTVTNRQLAIIGFVGILTIGLMAGLGYVAGRIASTGPSKVLMLESAQANESSTAPAPVELNRPSPTDPMIALKASPVPPLLPAADSSLRGLAYWQVGALDSGMAKVSEKYLQDRSMPVRLEAVAGSDLVRVLVGPAEGSELNQLKGQLDALGFQSFLKRY